MKIIKSLLITGLFSTILVLMSCNHNAKDSDTDSTVSSEGMDRPTVKNNKSDSTQHNDTIVTPVNDNDMKKNNPDITK